ncbi:MAG TPA: ABC transporter permease [Gemmatimonadales bacterium]|nr:ABC transporter permease [Gemmatimonadales bacterium]
MPSRIRAGVRRAFRLAVGRADEVRAEIDDEIAFHLEQRTAQLVRRGWPEEAARTEALRRLGPPFSTTRAALRRSAVRKEHRMQLHDWLAGTSQDFRYAWRGLTQRPMFTAIAVLTLAIGIGANTAIFSMFDALLLRALPFHDPARLVDIVQRSPFDPRNGGSNDEPWSYPKFMVVRDAQQSYSAVALYANENYILTGDAPERISGERVSAAYLGTLGVHPVVGHDFPLDEDAHADAPKYVLISTSLWQRRFNADRRAVGQILHIDGDSYEILGVLPAAFRGITGKADLLVPVTANPADELNAWNHSYSMVGRLKPGVTARAAAAEAVRLGALVARVIPLPKGFISSGPGGPWSAAARPLDDVRVGSTLRQSVMVLAGAVGLVLLIACVNLASLLLGRALARRDEIAVRLAIGAGRARLVRMLLSESLLLAALGGLASIAIAWWGTALLSRLDSQDALVAQGLGGAVGAAGFEAIHLDVRALAFAFCVTLVVGVLFGLVPALQATRPEVVEGLRHGSARGGARIGTSRRVLVIVELALAMVLLAGSGLMLRSLAKLLAIDPGFEASHVLTLRLTVPGGGMPVDSEPGFYRELQTRLAALPGVRRVALGDCPPLNGGCNGTLMTFPDRPKTTSGNAEVGVHWVTPSWFATLQVPLRRGRLFTEDDREGGPRVVLLSEAAVHKFWPHGEDPIGKRVAVWQGGFDAGATVVGIVGDVRYGTLDSTPAPDSYISYSQSPRPYMMIFLKTTGDPAALAPLARRTIRALAPRDPVYDVATMTDRIGTSTSTARLSATLLALFAAVALALAIMGIYGVVSFGVTQRTREIGIRMALGADPASVVALVVREGVVLAMAGGAVGLVAALVLTKAMRSLLYGVEPGDLTTYVGISLVLALAALLASWLPARVAASVDPVDALREG